MALYENISVSRSSLSGVDTQLDEQREKTVSSRDQEKLRKIKERLLLEDSDEEEGDLCRICQMGEESSSNPLIQPCPRGESDEEVRDNRPSIEFSDLDDDLEEEY
ncbi:hypothetical protein INR49_004188 [Caranx melampygus]|nr:hypothetical protein INR49_004188 [Caranx melampygus]